MTGVCGGVERQTFSWPTNIGRNDDSAQVQWIDNTAQRVLATLVHILNLIYVYFPTCHLPFSNPLWIGLDREEGNTEKTD